MKTIAILLLIMFIPCMALAWGITNPLDTASDKLNQSIDKMNESMDKQMQKVKDEATEVKNDIKAVIKFVLRTVLEGIVVIAVGWLFSYLVHGDTRKMIKVLTIVLAISWVTDKISPYLQ